MTSSFPTRKSNRLSTYNYSASNAYFITVCTLNRMRFLSNVQLRGGKPDVCKTASGQIVSRLIQAIPERFPSVEIQEYIIMPDHFHLLLCLQDAAPGTGDPSPTLGSVVGWLKYQTTAAINAQRGTPSAKVWQRSYYDHVIRGEQDYLETMQYIRNNPARWLETHHTP